MTQESREREHRRGHVYRLLKHGTGEKMMINRSQSAAAELRRAYDLARNPTPIVSPLYEIAAYRLANVLFRSARTVEDLREVDRLYAEATGDVGRRLGPMPFIHRVAVHHRLLACQNVPEPDRPGLRQQMERLYSEACELALGGHHGVLAGNVGGAHIQGSLHNLLELTAYYNDFDYEGRVSGLVSPFEDLQLGDDWIIVGTGGVERSVRMPRDLAALELEARARERADLLFELGVPRKRARFRAWVPDGQEALAGGRELLTLSRLCRGPSFDQQLYSAVYGDEPFDDVRLRDIIRDLRRFLSQLLGRPWSELLPEAPSGQPLELAPGLRIYGMVSVDSQRGYL